MGIVKTRPSAAGMQQSSVQGRIYSVSCFGYAHIMSPAVVVD